MEDVCAENDGALVDGLAGWAASACAARLAEVAAAPDDSAHYGVAVCPFALAADAPNALRTLLDDAPRGLPLLDAALRRAAERAADDVGAPPKALVHGRVALHRLCAARPLRPAVGEVRARHVGRLLVLRGTVIRTGPVRMLEAERCFACTRCAHRVLVAVDVEGGAPPVLPARCPGPRCTGATFAPVPDGFVCRDYQEVRLQEPAGALCLGATPRSITVVLEADLVDALKAGDDVEVTGHVVRRWKPLPKEARADVELVFHANALFQANERKASLALDPALCADFAAFWSAHADRPMAVRNRILASICPQVCGLADVRLATALTLIGGVPRVEGGARIRGESHLLLVGDPGTGKSQFMKFAARVAARSVVTTGMGSTNAGLTVTAVRDGGEWSLEAGALVLADGGLCCIDEFSAMREADKTTIHEAMEQQTISVAKAGLVTTLNARATVFGVTNPKGQYDTKQSIAVNTALSPPLLSRFDVVLVLLDRQDRAWDEQVSEHILREHGCGTNDTPAPANDPIWDLDTLRQYVCHVRETFAPVLTWEAERVLTGYYQLQRRTEARSAGRTTLRMLESLVRLTQAHARLTYRNEATSMDATVAVLLMEASMQAATILPDCDALRSVFPEDPDAEIAQLEVRVKDAIEAELGLTWFQRQPVGLLTDRGGGVDDDGQPPGKRPRT